MFGKFTKNMYKQSRKFCVGVIFVAIVIIAVIVTGGKQSQILQKFNLASRHFEI